MQIADELHYLRIYWVVGAGIKNDTYIHSVKSPPCAGWRGAYVIMGEKFSTIFCPFSFTTYQVTTDCHEITKARDPDSFNEKWAVENLKRTWKEHQTRGWQSDYDTAARVLTLLGADVPAQVRKGGDKDTRKKGGKPVAKTLLSPINPDSKRGKLLAWFVANGNKASVRSAMIKFDATRSAVLSNLRALNVDHGIGYELIGDDAKVILPPGYVLSGEDIEAGDPIKVEGDQALKALDEEDDSWLDGEDDSWLD